MTPRAWVRPAGGRWHIFIRYDIDSHLQGDTLYVDGIAKRVKCGARIGDGAEMTTEGRTLPDGLTCRRCYP